MRGVVCKRGNPVAPGPHSVCDDSTVAAFIDGEHLIASVMARPLFTESFVSAGLQ